MASPIESFLAISGDLLEWCVTLCRKYIPNKAFFKASPYFILIMNDNDI